MLHVSPIRVESSPYGVDLDSLGEGVAPADLLGRSQKCKVHFMLILCNQVSIAEETWRPVMGVKPTWIEPLT